HLTFGHKQTQPVLGQVTFLAIWIEPLRLKQSLLNQLLDIRAKLEQFSVPKQSPFFSIPLGKLHPRYDISRIFTYRTLPRSEDILLHIMVGSPRIRESQLGVEVHDRQDVKRTRCRESQIVTGRPYVLPPYRAPAWLDHVAPSRHSFIVPIMLAGFIEGT